MLTTGIKGKQECTVTPELTAEALGSGLLPVFATPAVIALAEETAWKSVAGGLEEGQGRYCRRPLILRIVQDCQRAHRSCLSCQNQKYQLR